MDVKLCQLCGLHNLMYEKDTVARKFGLYNTPVNYKEILSFKHNLISDNEDLDKCMSQGWAYWDTNFM